MAIFQPSVLKNFPQDESKIAQRSAKYQEFLSKIDYIKTQKEEKYQAQIYFIATQSLLKEK